MADHSKIEWTDATWNPITGCSVVSPGCTHCYAMKLAGTRLKHHPSRAGLTVEAKAGPVWNGKVRFNREWLDQPLRWKKPRMIFVCAHGDLFHESVPDEWIDRVFAVMALCPQHTFQVLTKRPERMRDYLSWDDRDMTVQLAAFQLHNEEFRRGANRFGSITYDPIEETWFLPWPLPNVWIGVSVEDQRRAEERIPRLLDTPAALRWISAEPLLGSMQLDDLCTGHKFIDALRGNWWHDDPDGPNPISRGHAKLDWVVAGGESGPDARPMHPDWARSLRDQCAAAGVPFLFKQWGSFRPCTAKELTSACGATRVTDEITAPAFMLPASKGVSGRTLDGVIHDDFPQTARMNP